MVERNRIVPRNSQRKKCEQKSKKNLFINDVNTRFRAVEDLWNSDVDTEDAMEYAEEIFNERYKHGYFDSDQDLVNRTKCVTQNTIQNSNYTIIYIYQDEITLKNRFVILYYR